MRGYASKCITNDTFYKNPNLSSVGVFTYRISLIDSDSSIELIYIIEVRASQAPTMLEIAVAQNHFVYKMILLLKKAM